MVDRHDYKTKGPDDVVIVVTALILIYYFGHKLRAVDYTEFVWYILAVMASVVLVVSLILIVYHRRHQLRPDKWGDMSGRQFEDQIVLWLKECGYIKTTKTEYFDQGLDIIATKPGVILGVQVKRSARPVGINAVRAAIAGLKSYGCTQAMVITNSTFTSPAIRLAESNDCELVNGQDLLSAIKRVDAGLLKKRFWSGKP